MISKNKIHIFVKGNDKEIKSICGIKLHKPDFYENKRICKRCFKISGVNYYKMSDYIYYYGVIK